MASSATLRFRGLALVDDGLCYAVHGFRNRAGMIRSRQQHVKPDP